MTRQTWIVNVEVEEPTFVWQRYKQPLSFKTMTAECKSALKDLGSVILDQLIFFSVTCPIPITYQLLGP